MVNDFVMPFGKYKGKTLDEISQTDEGLMYLDWAVGEFDNGLVKAAITEFLDDPAISQEIERLL